MALISGIHHISMNCEKGAEYEKVLQFYRDILGMELIREWENGGMLSAGNVLLEVFTTGGGIKEKGAIRHIAFAVEDTDACAEAVRQAGYEVFVEPKEVEIPSTPPLYARVAFCKGVLGEEVEFFCERTAK